MFNKHFQEFIELLKDKGVEFLIVGGYAVGIHGFPRYTGDLDVFVGISERNAAQLLEVFAEFGFGEIGLNKEDFMESETVVEIGREPIKIQVLTGIDGVSFSECHEHAETFQIGEQTVPFISYQDLIKNKAASPRAKDKIDLEELRHRKEDKSS